MTDSNARSLSLYGRLLQFVKPYWPLLALGVLANMTFAGMDAGLTYTLKPLMNDGFIARDAGFIRWFPVVMLGLFIFRGVTSFAASYCMTRVARTVVMDFRQAMFAHLLRLPARYYDRASSGKLLSKLLYDVEQLAQVSTDALTTLVQSGCFVIGLFTVMLVISWRLCLIYLLLVPIIAVIVIYTSKRIRRVSHTVQNAMAEVTEIAQESIEGYRVVRTFGGQTIQKNKFNGAVKSSRDRDLKVAVTKAINVSGVQIVAASGISLIIYLAISPHSFGTLSPGGFASMMVAMIALLKPLKNLTTVSSIIQRGLAGAHSVFKFLDLAPEQDNGHQQLNSPEVAVSFQHVYFAYGDKTVLSDIDFTIPPGKTVAMVGRSGSGKTTIASLLPRFYDVQSGLITINDQDVRSLSLATLREHIAYVSQQVTLFNDSIANNIAYGQENASREQIIAAAKDANALEFINRLPQGFDTPVGENGTLLSGGQRQRIAIARALLKDSPILILDEATSALDTQSERLIQSALDRVMKNRTTLVIAHRLSTIEKADIILVIDEGRIVERGNHQALLAKSGIYAELYNLQHQATAEQLMTTELADEPVA